MKLQESKTKENLQRALEGESIARNKYTYFSEIARKNGDNEIAQLFEQLAQNEMMHAKFWFKQLFDQPTTTEDCLRLTMQGENAEGESMYPQFAKIAREEGFDQLAAMFDMVANIERTHETRLSQALDKLTGGGTSAKTKKTAYRCQFCGAVFEERPDICNVCEAIGAFDKFTYYE